MREYLFFLIIIMCLPSSYGSHRPNRTFKVIKNLNQHDFELGTNTIRDESQLLNFIETTMETYLIPGMQISVVKGRNIVWNKHFGYANIDENILVDGNTIFILSSASKAITAAALMHLFEKNLFSLDDAEFLSVYLGTVPAITLGIVLSFIPRFSEELVVGEDKWVTAIPYNI